MRKPGKPIHNFWPLVLTYSVEEAERIAAKEAPRGSEKFSELVRDFLKTPNRKEWQLTPATDFRPIEAQAIAERRNVGLIVSRVRELRPDLSLMCLDIDAQTPEALAFAEHCGRRRAFVYRTRRGLHIWLQVRGVGGQFPDFPAQVEGVIVEGMLYPGRVDVFFTARKQILLPAAGTPRGDECEILWAGGVNLEGKGVQFSLSAILAAFETLPLLEVMIPAEVAPRDVQGGSGTWARIFGEGWRSMPLEKIAQRVREAVKGERNETLFQSAILCGYRGFEFEKVEAALLEAAKFVFGYGDPEFSGGTFRGARDTIRRGVEIGQKLAEQREEGRIKKGGAVEGGEDGGESEASSRRRVARAVEFLKEQGAMICADCGQEYVLYRGQAVPLGTLYGFCLLQPEPQLNTLSRHDQSNLEQIAAQQLPRTNVREGKAIIVRKFVRPWRGREVGVIKIEKSIDEPGHKTAKKVADFIDFLTRCRLMSAAEAEDLLQTYIAAPVGDRLYVVEAFCSDEEGGRVLKLLGHPVGQLPEGVYIPTDLGHPPRVGLGAFALWLAHTVTVGRESEAALKEFAPVLRAVLSGEPFQMTLAAWAELPRSYLAEYLIDLARYHSNAAYWAYVDGETDSPYASRELIARSLVALSTTAFAPGLLLIRGATGAGKTVASRRLTYAITATRSNFVASGTIDSLHTVAKEERVIEIEEADQLNENLEAYIKSVVTGGEFKFRQIYTSKTTSERGHDVSFIINTAALIKFEGDTGRRSVALYIAPAVKSEPLDLIFDRVERITALDTISIAALRVVALSARTVFDTDWRGWASDEYLKPPEGFPEWATQLADLSITLPYLTAARAFGVPDEIAEKVLREAKELVFEHIKPGWPEVIDLGETDLKFAQDFKNGLSPIEIARRLQRAGHFKSLTAAGLARQLGKEFDRSAEFFRARGWHVERYKSNGTRFRGWRKD